MIENYNRILNEIHEIAASCGRNPEEIKLIAVSKTFEASVVQGAIDAGIRLFGENKVQEARTKIPLLKGDFVFHMIGHLQSNKTKEAVRMFDMIHSLDSFSTATKVDGEAAGIGKRQKVLIQVNASGENSKSGVSPASAVELAGQVLGLKSLDLRGLMTMAPFTEDKDLIRSAFRKTREMLERINSVHNLHLSELSMGMSSDYRIAVEEGATLVRIGTAIFGHRTIE
jgi:pyridoxal phosphate enzyme (YggS family)